MSDPDTPGLTPSECARRRGISKQAVIKAIHQGRLSATKAGRHYIIKTTDCDCYPVHAANQRAGAASAAARRREEEGL